MNKISPFLWFDKEAAEAARFYCTIFKDAKIVDTTLMENTPSGTVEIVTLEMFGQTYQLMSAGPLFKFNEAISFVIYCENQEEIDYYWDKLSADPYGGECGWLKDKFGLSWQVVPRVMTEMLKSKDKATLARVTGAIMKMKKFDLAALQEAYEPN